MLMRVIAEVVIVTAHIFILTYMSSRLEMTEREI